MKKYNNHKLLQKQLREFYTSHKPCNLIHDFIDCTRDEFRIYIDNLLQEDMSFFNMGKEWCLDHIVPVTLFDLSEYNLAWNYQNILPMYTLDNKMKGSSVHFSYQYLSNLKNKTDITNKLIEKCLEELKRYDKYL